METNFSCYVTYEFTLNSRGGTDVKIQLVSISHLEEGKKPEFVVLRKELTMAHPVNYSADFFETEDDAGNAFLFLLGLIIKPHKENENQTETKEFCLNDLMAENWAGPYALNSQPGHLKEIKATDGLAPWFLAENQDQIDGDCVLLDKHHF